MRYDSAHDAILIVEDEALLREVETYMFEDAGYRVFTVETAHDAAHFLREHDKINVLFTDVNMPGPISETDLAQYVSKRWPRIGIVIVSGQLLADNIPSGASFHYKPFEAQAVLHDVRKLAARSRAQSRGGDGGAV
jgi:two-component system, response regulator PdtaR